MPKIIENLPQLLKEEAARQVLESGYAAVTIRSVAKACGVGVGTVYNYYPSKEMLIASFMLEDWQSAMAQINRCAENAKEAAAVMQIIYDQLQQFIRHNKPIIGDKDAAPAFFAAIGSYHAILRQQLAQPLRKFCPDDFTAQFIAESLLTWTVKGQPAEELFAVINKILKER